MRARLAGLVAAVAVVLVAAPTNFAGISLADPICPNGTNWNNSLQACS